MASSEGAVNRAEIDTSLPFRSVKAAVSMFGEKSEVKKFKKQSRHEEQEEELKSLREELASMKLRLRNAENDKAVAMAELRTKNKFNEEFPNVKPESISYEHRMNAAETQQADLITVAREQHIEEYESIRRNPKGKKEDAVCQEEHAFPSVEMNAKSVNQLSKQVSTANEPLTLTKLSCNEAKQGVHHSSLWPHPDVSTIEELELKLVAATKDLAMLQRELETGDEARQQISLAASEALLNLSVPLHVSSSAPVRDDSAAKDLKKSIEIRACLEFSMKALQAELENLSKELYELKDREANASAAVVTLTRELSKAKRELIEAIRTESKATEAILGLSNALQQVTAEAEQAKEEAKALMEGANQARADAEIAKAVMNDADRRLQEAARSVEAEANALQRYKEMYDRAIAGAECGSQQVAWNEYLMGSPQPWNSNTDKGDIQLANNRSKKKKHLIPSLTNLLGKKGPSIQHYN